MIVAGIGFIIFWICFIRADPEEYQKIMERANPTLQLEAGRPFKASQRRKGVQKNFWQVKENFHLVSQVNCEESDLVIEQKEGAQVIVEYMKGVLCLIQEELFYLDPSGNKIFDAKGSEPLGKVQQTIRVIRAGRAKYHYSSEILEAEDVNMSLYTIPGRELPHSFNGFIPSMEGRAETLNLAIIEKELRFKADNFKGTLF